MAQTPAGAIASVATPVAKRTPLDRQQIIGFWAAWFGWMLDGMDSVIYALVLGPALTELLPRSGIEATPANIGYVGSLMFGLFLVGWGLSFIWGPISDRFGRTKSLAATILVHPSGIEGLIFGWWGYAIRREASLRRSSGRAWPWWR
jgi:MFS family permease